MRSPDCLGPSTRPDDVSRPYVVSHALLVMPCVPRDLSLVERRQEVDRPSQRPEDETVRVSLRGGTTYPSRRQVEENPPERHQRQPRRERGSCPSEVWSGRPPSRLAPLQRDSL